MVERVHERRRCFGRPSRRHERRGTASGSGRFRIADAIVIRDVRTAARNTVTSVINAPRAIAEATVPGRTEGGEGGGREDQHREESGADQGGRGDG